MNNQQEQKLEDLKAQLKVTHKSIADLEESLKKRAEPWVTSQGTEEGREARNKYFGEGFSPFMYRTHQGFENFEECQLEDPYYTVTQQAPPQVGYWYWRESIEEFPPMDKKVICLFKCGTFSRTSKALEWGWNDDNLIAYMLLD